MRLMLVIRSSFGKSLEAITMSAFLVCHDQGCGRLVSVARQRQPSRTWHRNDQSRVFTSVLSVGTQEHRSPEIEIAVVGAQDDLVGRARQDGEEGDVLAGPQGVRGLTPNSVITRSRDRQQDREPHGWIGEEEGGESVDVGGRTRRQGDGKTVGQAGAGIPVTEAALGGRGNAAHGTEYGNGSGRGPRDALTRDDPCGASPA